MESLQDIEKIIANFKASIQIMPDEKEQLQVFAVSFGHQKRFFG